LMMVWYVAVDGCDDDDEDMRMDDRAEKLASLYLQADAGDKARVESIGAELAVMSRWSDHEKEAKLLVPVLSKLVGRTAPKSVEAHPWHRLPAQRSTAATAPT